MKKYLLVHLASILIFCNASYGQYEVYVSSGFGPTSSIKKFDADGNFIENFVAPSASPLNWPQDILFINNDTEAIVTGLNNNAIFRYDGATGALIDTFAYTISGPTRIKIGPDGYLYALEWSGGGRVMRYDLAGNFIDTFTNIPVIESIGLDWDASNNLYVSSFSGAEVFRFDPSGNYTDNPISGSLAAVGPTNLWFAPSGDMYILDWTGNKVVHYNASFQVQPTFIAGISKPEGIAQLPNGDLLIGSGGSNPQIRRYDSAGNFIGVFASGNGLENPNAIYVKFSGAGLDEGSIHQVPSVHPTVGSVFFVHGTKSEDATIRLYSLNGVFLKDLNLQANGSFITNDLSEGVYFVSINEGEAQRIIVKK